VDKTKEMNRKIGLNIQNERKKACLLQEEVAKILGVTRTTVINYERGKGISASLIAQMSNIFKCPIDNFYLGLDITKC
jgi:transcriptional regulator with XRE-family HTH domain